MEKKWDLRSLINKGLEIPRVYFLDREESVLNQEETRQKYIERLIREKQTYISCVTGIPSSVLSEF